MKDDPNIDELLNSFIDGELTQRQHTEVQRMATHDKAIAQRLRRLRKCKMLVGSLPFVEAPAAMLEDIKASLERRPLSARQPFRRGKLVPPSGALWTAEAGKSSEGARHLLVRRLVTAAAMVGLVAVLGAVIYSILSPTEIAIDEPIVVVKHRPQPLKPVAGTAEPTAAQFCVRLELSTSDFTATDEFIRSAIENNGLLDQVASPIRGDAKGVHLVTCGRKDLNLLLTDLQNVWSGLGSATLFVDADRADGRIVVPNVTSEQIWEIANQHNFQGRIKAAKYFAVLNDISGLLPGQKPFTTTDIAAPDLTAIPRPVLTSGGEITKSAAEQRISLTIVVTVVAVDN